MVVISVLDVFQANNFVNAQIYVEAASDVDFTNPVTLGVLETTTGALTFNSATVLTNYYFRIIFAFEHTGTKNSGVTITGITFN